MREQAEALVGKLYNVVAHSLVFVRGGELLCIECGFYDGEAEDLVQLAPADWIPHITLLTERNGRFMAKDSTAVLEAWRRAKAESQTHKSSGSVQEDPIANETSAPSNADAGCADAAPEQAEHEGDLQEGAAEDEEDDQCVFSP